MEDKESKIIAVTKVVYKTKSNLGGLIQNGKL